ncbi:MAG: AmmeMemoRadiSam system protein B [Alphaproteobacteria bacterium]
MAIALDDVKPLKFSGSWYPQDATALREMVTDFVEGAKPYPFAPKMMIVPHAGLRFSGSIAGTAYRILEAQKSKIERVILIGPSHRTNFKGIAIPSHAFFETPFGHLPVNQEALTALKNIDGVETSDAVFEEEHCLELQFPFVHQVLKNVSIVPMIVGLADPELVAAALAEIWGGEETVILISSDLSHYHDYMTARSLDKKSAGMIEALSPKLTGMNACGHRVINGALQRAKNINMRVTGIDVRNSGDTVGSKDRVVGYGSFIFEYAASATLPESYREELRRVAYASIQKGIRKGAPPQVFLGSFSRPLEAVRGCFVTLTTKDGRLRGCIGSPQPHRPLVQDVVENAFKAAFGDRRFKPLTEKELTQIDLKIAVLSTLSPIPCNSHDELLAALKPDVEGLVIRDKGKNALFLPSVWESIPKPEFFLQRLKEKAGMKPDHWSDTFEAFSFTTEVF